MNMERRHIRGWRLASACLLIAAILAAACFSPAEGLRPTERQQIQNLVRDYWQRNTDIPEYEVDVDAVAQDWARARLMPAGVENQEPVYVFLQKQAGQEGLTPAPTPELEVQPGNLASLSTTTGWTIVLGPEAAFTQDQLDAAGVPESIRP